MKRILAGALLVGTAITSAQGADLQARPYTKAPAPMLAVYDWTGFYLGVNVGLGLGRDRITHGFTGFNDTTYTQPQGLVGGGQIGYNWQNNASLLGLGPIVFGIEADIQGADMRDGRNLLNSAGGVTTSYNQRLDWFGTVRGRIGLSKGPVFSYFTGGFAYGSVKTDVIQTLGAVAGATPLENGMRTGYVLGSGVEAALGGNWTGKIEYLYLNMGSKDFAFTNIGIPQALNSEIRENIFRVGLNYRIGGNSAYVPDAANWAGLYLGGNVGGSGAGRDRSSLTVGGVTDTFNLARDGIIGGVQAGYNWQAGNIVFGLEADIQGSSQREKDTCVLSCSALAGAAYDARLPWFGTARGRLGYAVGSTLFYATGGYAYGNVKTDITTNVLGAFTTTSLKNNKSGYAVGAGIETPFTLLGLFGPNWTSKSEYLYVDLGSQTDTFVANGVAFTNSTKVQQHVFRTGINYHFNSPVVARY
ncbi:MAG: porin [Tardiphaga sp.]|nr:porin [Tardiphaga sp.]